MPAPLIPEQLLQLVEKSNLIPPQRLEDLVTSGEVEKSSSVKELAKLMVERGLLTHFQSEQLLNGKWRGFSIGKYKVLERLGSGGMGSVYLCEHVQMRHKVAVKVLPTSRSTDPSALGRFYREARAAASLQHPNIVPAHDVDQDGELHFLVMDYVEGVNLQQLIGRRKKPITVLRACHYILQAAKGLAHAHEAGLVHRDVKPANSLLDRQGVVRVLDLGLARFYEDNQDLLTLKYDDKSLLGTADYVSPEQAINSHNVDTRTDIYSLGATFYFLIAGHPPFPGGKVSQKLLWHQSREPKPIQEIRPEVPARLAAILGKMMAKNLDRRYQTTQEVIDALEPFVQQPIQPPSEDEIPKLSLAARTSTFANSQGPTLTPAPRPRRTRPSSLHDPDPTDLQVPGTDRVATSTMKPMETNKAPSSEQPKKHDTPVPQEHETLHEDSTLRSPIAHNAPVPIPPPNRWRWIVTFLVVLAAGGAGGFALHWTYRTHAQPKTPAESSSTWIVAKGQGDRVVSSVRLALSKAKPGDRIEVREETWSEILTLTAKDKVSAGVTIVGKSPSGKTVTWTPTNEASANQALWNFQGVHDLTLKGFALDGQNRQASLIHVRGSSANLKLENLTLTAFTETGVRLEDCSGSAGKPMVIRKVRAAPGRSARRGVLLTGSTAQTTRHVQIVESRFEGPCNAGVEIHGRIEELDVSDNRFFNLIDGVLVQGGSAKDVLKLKLVANSFHEIRQAALHFEQAPSGNSRVTLQRNLIAGTRRLGQIDGFSPQVNSTAQWVTSPNVMKTDAQESHYFRKTFVVAGTATKANLNVVCQEGFTVWINGKRIGSRSWNPKRRRVHSFDVTNYLHSGTNAISIQADKGNLTFGLLADLQGTTALQEFQVVTDSTWTTAKRAAPGWTQSGFNDQRWDNAQVIAPLGGGPKEWRSLVWECRLREQFGERFEQVFLSPSGNVRDPNSQEGFPSFEARPVEVNLPTDPGNDEQFLRHPEFGARK